ncbi:MAG: DNA polymerase III subunit delta [bacterium]|nr:DNA polymerase III subunit delta [bacterium]
MSVYFFYGQDTFSLLEELKEFKDKWRVDHPNAGMEELRVESNSSDQELRMRLREHLENQGLFANEKLIIIHDCIDRLSKLSSTERYILDVLNNPPRSTALIFVETEGVDKRRTAFKKLKKAATVREFAPLARANLETWIKNRLEKQRVKMEKSAIAKFLDLLQTDDEEEIYNLWQIVSELEKLILYSGGKNIAEGDVTKLVAPNISQNVFALTNLFAEGDSAQAIALLDDLVGRGQIAEERNQSIAIVGALASQIRSLLLVKDLEDQGPAEIAKILDWKEGRVWINLKLAKKFTKAILVKSLEDLRAIDFRLKTSEEPPKLLLSLFIQKVSSTTRADKAFLPALKI